MALGKTLNQLVDAVRSYSSLYVKYTLSDDQIKDWLNYRYQEILRKEDWPFLRKTITLNVQTGTTKYTLPATVREVEQVIASESGRGFSLRERSAGAEDLFYEQAPNSRLNDYTIEYEGRSLVLHLTPAPRANQVLQVQVLTRAPELGDNDMPIFDDEYHNGLAHGATVDALMRETSENSDRVKYHNSEYGAVYSDMADKYLPSQSTRPFIMNGRMSGRRNGGRRYN